MNNLGIFHFLFYLLVASLYIYTFCIYDARLFNEGKYAKAGFPFDDSYGRRAKFLTYNNVVIQIVFFSLSTLSALQNLITRDANSSLRKFTNFLYTSFAFPIGVIVSVLFWSLYYIDRDLVFPDILDSIMPSWLNHVLHTLPIVSLLVEAYVTQHSYPSFLKGASWTATFLVGYICWTLYIAFESDKWVYNILKMLTPINRAIFIVSQAAFAVFLYKMGDYLNGSIWQKKSKKI